MFDDERNFLTKDIEYINLKDRQYNCRNII